MNLELSNKLFIVGGATSGFGKAITELLLSEGAHVIGVARSEMKLNNLKQQFSGMFQYVAADLTEDKTINRIKALIAERQVHGILINAGGPPAKTVLETTLSDWDQSYQLLLRWKVGFIQAFLPSMLKVNYGRILFIESSTVKQPLENLVLSNSLRLAAVGFVKTLSQEIARSGITINVMAPGSHDTPAIERIYKKKSEQTGIPEQEIRNIAIQQIPTGYLGSAKDFATLALWLLSPMSRYVTGQVYAVDGGAIKGTF